MEVQCIPLDLSAVWRQTFYALMARVNPSLTGTDSLTPLPPFSKSLEAMAGVL